MAPEGTLFSVDFVCPNRCRIQEKQRLSCFRYMIKLDHNLHRDVLFQTGQDDISYQFPDMHKAEKRVNSDYRSQSQRICEANQPLPTSIVQVDLTVLTNYHNSCAYYTARKKYDLSIYQ